MKPDWKDAPEWANWLTMDDDGEWYWHETEPSLRYEEYWLAKEGRRGYAGFSCRIPTKEARP